MKIKTVIMSRPAAAPAGSSTSVVAHWKKGRRVGKVSKITAGLNDKSVHRMKQFLVPFFIQQATLSDSFWTGGSNPVLAPRLVDLPGVSSYSGMFDQYRIVEMELFVYPSRRAGVCIGVPIANVLPPSVLIAADYDDQNTPALFTDLLQYQNSIMADPYCPVHYKVTPRAHIASATGGTFPSTPGTWIDIASQSESHYGIKIGVTGGAYSQTDLWSAQVTVRVTIDFKQVR